MNIDELVATVEPESQVPLRVFLNTGEATEEFLDHLDTCEKCQAIADEGFKEQSRKLERLAEALAINQDGRYNTDESVIDLFKSSRIFWFIVGLVIGILLL